jgi:hypothetical protein
VNKPLEQPSGRFYGREYAERVPMTTDTNQRRLLLGADLFSQHHGASARSVPHQESNSTRACCNDGDMGLHGDQYGGDGLVPWGRPARAAIHLQPVSELLVSAADR